MIPTKCYCDGGTVRTNPSKYGATWAWVWVDRHGEILKEDYGLVEPEDLGMKLLTNNIAELLAAVRAIEALPKDWEGVIYTDSSITLARITGGNKFANVPDWLITRTKALTQQRKWKACLLAGHPTKKDLARGYKERNGLPVSIYNKRCDELCNAASKQFQMEMEL